MGSGSGSGSRSGSGSGSGSGSRLGKPRGRQPLGFVDARLQNCRTNTDPEVQVHAYNATVHIIRQNKCDDVRGAVHLPDRGLDHRARDRHGATNTTTLRDTIRGLIGTKPLIVAHSHAHGDHTAGDSRFSGQPNTTVVATTRRRDPGSGSASRPGRRRRARSISAVACSTSLAHPRSRGDARRVLRPQDRSPPHRRLALPGPALHQRLGDVPHERAPARRVRRDAPIAHVLGAHVEMSSTPKQVYPYGTTYQPAEHVLELTAAHVAELDAALDPARCDAAGADVAHDDFVIDPQ